MQICVIGPQCVKEFQTQVHVTQHTRCLLLLENQKITLSHSSTDRTSDVDFSGLVKVLVGAWPSRGCSYCRIHPLAFLDSKGSLHSLAQDPLLSSEPNMAHRVFLHPILWALAALPPSFTFEDPCGSNSPTRVMFLF